MVRGAIVVVMAGRNGERFAEGLQREAILVVVAMGDGTVGAGTELQRDVVFMIDQIRVGQDETDIREATRRRE
jgi:hypothetical protein